MPCLLGDTVEQRRDVFFDLVDQLGQFYNFGFEEYERMKTSDLMRLYKRFSAEMKRRKRESRRR